MANYVVSANADDDLIRILEFGIEQFGINAAEQYFDDLHVAFDKIAENPLIYPPSLTRQGYRVYALLRDTIYYRINNDTVEIIAIIGNQDEGVWVG